MAGLKPPNFTQIPNEVLDNIHLMNESELRVLLVICRKTFGWHKERDILSISQLKALTGLSKPGVMSGIADAMNRGLLERVPAGKQSFSYRLLVNLPDQSTELTSKTTLPEPYNLPDRSLVNSVDTQNKDVNKKESGGDRARAQEPVPAPRPTPPPQVSASDEAMKTTLGFDATQRRNVNAKRPPLSTDEITFLPDWIRDLKQRGVNRPAGYIYKQFLEGRLVPCPEQDEPQGPPVEWIYDEPSNTMRPSDPVAWARITAQQNGQPQQRIPH